MITVLSFKKAMSGGETFIRKISVQRKNGHAYKCKYKRAV